MNGTVIVVRNSKGDVIGVASDRQSAINLLERQRLRSLRFGGSMDKLLWQAITDENGAEVGSIKEFSIHSIGELAALCVRSIIHSPSHHAADLAKTMIG